jgi:hypothetical protein
MSSGEWRSDTVCVSPFYLVALVAFCGSTYEYFCLLRTEEGRSSVCATRDSIGPSDDMNPGQGQGCARDAEFSKVLAGNGREKNLKGARAKLL